MNKPVRLLVLFIISSLFDIFILKEERDYPIEYYGHIFKNSEAVRKAVRKKQEYMYMKEIPVNSFNTISIGRTENAEAGTGCTVFLSKEGMRAGLDVRGGGRATRDSRLLDPLTFCRMTTSLNLNIAKSYIFVERLDRSDLMRFCLKTVQI